MRHTGGTAARLASALVALVLLAACRVVPDGAPARTASPTSEVERLLTSPVPGVAFPRQEPVEGVRTYMLAALTGVLDLDDGCLWVQSLYDDSRVLPIWPPELSIRADGERLLLINPSIPISASGSADEQVVAVVGEEVHMGGGHVPSVGEWVVGQVPPVCQGNYFLVGDPLSVRPNLRHDSELIALRMVVEEDTTILMLHHRPAFVAQAAEPETLSGELVLYDYQRCVQLQTGRGPGPVTLLWPLDWAVRLEGDAVQILDGSGEAVARTGESVSLRGRPIVQDWESEIYRRAVQELPGDGCCTFWLVEGVE